MSLNTEIPGYQRVARILPGGFPARVRRLPIGRHVVSQHDSSSALAPDENAVPGFPFKFTQGRSYVYCVALLYGCAFLLFRCSFLLFRYMFLLLWTRTCQSWVKSYLRQYDAKCRFCGHRWIRLGGESSVARVTGHGRQKYVTGYGLAMSCRHSRGHDPCLWRHPGDPAYVSSYVVTGGNVPSGN